MSDFAAGHFAKADLQQVYVRICSGSMYVSVSHFGSYRQRYIRVNLGPRNSNGMSVRGTPVCDEDLCLGVKMSHYVSFTFYMFILFFRHSMALHRSLTSDIQ